MAVLLTYRFWIGANRLGGETTSGGERRLGGNDQGGNVLGAKRLGGEIVWGRNDPDSPKQPWAGTIQILQRRPN